MGESQAGATRAQTVLEKDEHVEQIERLFEGI